MNSNHFLLGQGYYNEPYYQDANPGSSEAEEPGHSAMFDDEAVRIVLPRCHAFECTSLTG